MNDLTCTNCGEYFIYVIDCPSEIIHHEGETFCSTDCKHEHFEMTECVYCEEMATCEHHDDEIYEGTTCSQDCHMDAIHLWGYNKGDPNREHRTY